MSLQFIKRLPHLAYLIGLGHFAVTLQVDTRIAGPRCFEYMVATCNPWLTKVLATYLQKFAEHYVAVIIKVDGDIFSHRSDDSAYAITLQDEFPLLI